MRPLVFANNPLGTPEASPDKSGWQSVTQDGETAPSETSGSDLDQAKQIKMEPVRRKKRRRGNPEAGTDLGLHRDMGRDNYGGDPATYQQPYTPFKDQSNREFYYAPGDPGLTGGRLVFAETVECEWCGKPFEPEVRGQHACSPHCPEAPADSEEIFHELHLDAEDTLFQDAPSTFPAPQGGSDLIQDTNLTPRQYPRPVRFSDRRRRQDYKKDGYQPSGLPEPPPTPGVDFALGDVEWPLNGALVFAAEDDPTKMTWFFGYPEPLRTVAEGKAVVHPFAVAIYDNEESDNPVLNLVFNIKQVGNKLSMMKDYDLSFFDQKAGEKRFGVADLSRLGDAVEDNIVAQLPKELVQDAMETVVPPSPEELARRADKKAKQDAKTKKAEKPAEALAAPKAPEKAPRVPNFANVRRQDLGKYMFKENRELYEKAPEADQDRVLQLVRETLGNAWEKKMSVEDVRRELEKVVDATLAPAGRGREEKNERRKRGSYNVLDDSVLTKLAPNMSPEERLFTGIRNWSGDFFYADPKKLDATTRSMLQKRKTGEGPFFSWTLVDEDDIDRQEEKQIAEGGHTVEMQPSLVIQRLEPWKKIQEQVFQERNKILEGKK